MTIPDFTPVTVDTETPDFTPQSTVKFMLYGEEYYGVAELTLEDTFAYDALSMQLNDTTRTIEQRVEAMRQVMRSLLQPDSAERLIRGLGDRDKPIGYRTLMKVFSYIMSEYGERPTEPGSDSSVGSDDPESGTPSTENSPHAA